MYINLWGWYYEYEQQAIREGNIQKKRMINLHRLGWRYLDAGQFDEALTAYEDGLRLAQQLKESSWELVFDNYCCEVLMFYKAQYKEGLDRIVRLASRAYKAQYQSCPVRASVYYNLADIYYDIDCIGYENKMREMLDYIEKDVPMDQDTHLRVRFLRAEIAVEFGNYDEVEDIVQALLAHSEGNNTRKTQGYRLLQVVAFSRGDLLLALDHIRTCEKFAIQSANWRSVANATLWQALLHRYLGDHALAQQTLQQGLDLYKRYALPHRETYHGVLADYYELCGEGEKALKQREIQLAEMHDYRTIRTESSARLHYCRLLGRLQKPLDAALADARALTAEMQKPDLYLKWLKAIEEGSYYEFDWQKPDTATG